MEDNLQCMVIKFKCRFLKGWPGLCDLIQAHDSRKGPNIVKIISLEELEDAGKD